MKNQSGFMRLLRAAGAALLLAASPAAFGQICGTACSGSGVLQFSAPDQGQFGFARQRSMSAPPHLLQVDRPYFGSTSHNPDFTNTIRINVNAPHEGGTGEDYSIFFILPNNAVPSPGTHSATRYPFNATSAAGFDFSGTGQGCNTSQSTFTIHEVVFGPGTAVQSLAVDFTHRCGDSTTNRPFTVGYLRFNSTYPIAGAPTTPAGLPDSDGDGIPDSVEIAEGRNPYAKDNDLSVPRLFAMQQYRDFLGREGDPGGVAFWSSQISSGAMTQAQVVEHFMNSGEFQLVGGAVARLYLAYFLRPPDYEGLSFWVGYAAAGNSLAAISEHFAGSSEFRQRYGSMGNREFVRLVYRNVLGREPDAAGWDYWTNLLDNRRRWGEVMLNFSESPEFRALSHPEVAVIFGYAGMLRRAPDSGGFFFWVGYLDSGNAVGSFLGQILASPEYRTRFMP